MAKIDPFTVLVYHCKKNIERLKNRLAKLVEFDDAGCLIWRGTVNHNGYGCINFRMPKQYPVNHVQFGAHMIFWVLANKRNPRPGFELDHKCRNPVCVLPAHLQEVPLAVNRANIRRHW